MQHRNAQFLASLRWGYIKGAQVLNVSATAPLMLPALICKKLGISTKLVFNTMFLLICGCTPITQNFWQAHQDYQRFDYPNAIAKFRQDENRQDENQVFYNLHLAQAALEGGDVWDAKRSLTTATQIMTSTAGNSRGALSLVSAERLKLFKGEPFEKAMAFLYLGLIYYNEADYQNARAAFSQALLMDKQAQRGFDEDLRLVYYLLAKTYLRLQDPANAAIAMNKANQRNPQEPYPANPYYDLELAEQTVVTILVGLGQVPLKVRQGPGASLDTFVPRKTPEAHVQLHWGGQNLGYGVLALDLNYEAQHRGSSGKDSVQAAKGVARDAALVTAAVSDNEKVQLGALLFALTNQSQADIRQWESLPASLHLLRIRRPNPMPAQTHQTLQLAFADAQQRWLPNFRQVWYDFPMFDPPDQILWFRAGAYKGFKAKEVTK